MPDFYDRLETRIPSARENALFRDLRHVLTVSKSRVPALRAQLKGVSLTGPFSRDDLSEIPVLRRSAMLALQGECPPFGGMVATRLAGLKQVLVGTAAVASLEGQAKDWWGMGRALFAAGLRKGSLVLNCFSYDLVPHGHMVAAGAAALGSPVIPGGNADLDRKIDAIERFHPTFFCGEADHLKALLDHAADRHADVSSLARALVIGPVSPGLRSELEMRGVVVRCAYAPPEIGLVAFESHDTSLILNEGLVLEIVEPSTGSRVSPEDEGEVVITRINADYPLLRYAPGASTVLDPQPSQCGRTNTRLRMPRQASVAVGQPEADRVHVAHIEEIAHRHPDVGRMQLRIVRRYEGDEAHLRVEHGGDKHDLDRLTASLMAVTHLAGTVEAVGMGALVDEDPIVVDDRRDAR